jgi:hypothetical protein
MRSELRFLMIVDFLLLQSTISTGKIPRVESTFSKFQCGHRRTYNSHSPVTTRNRNPVLGKWHW